MVYPELRVPKRSVASEPRLSEKTECAFVRFSQRQRGISQMYRTPAVKWKGSRMSTSSSCRPRPLEFVEDLLVIERVLRKSASRGNSRTRIRCLLALGSRRYC